ncbi:MAG: hypothetical protein U5L04_15075 [Trueperaceae bacterium]|nr:hypothetical protein [Trueperaceae bacterium]
MKLHLEVKRVRQNGCPAGRRASRRVRVAATPAKVGADHGTPGARHRACARVGTASVDVGS